MFTEIKIQREIRHTFNHTFTICYLKALFSDMPHSLLPQHSLFSRYCRSFFFFSSNFRNNGTITPITNSNSLQLIQSSKLKSLKQHHFSLNHPAGFFLKHYFYPCIVHFAYKNQICGQSRDVQNTRECSNPSIHEIQLQFSSSCYFGCRLIT
jgi:hypothetical protein